MNGSDSTLQVLNKIKDLLAPNTVCVGFETLSITSTATSLTSVPTAANSALIQIQSNITTDAIRYREDGTAPTATVGKFKGNGDEFEVISNESLKQIKIIQGTSGTTQLNISYYK